MSHGFMPEAARAWLAQPELVRLWDKIHERLQRNGIAIRGHVVIPDATHGEREALSLLMGRAYTVSRVNVALSDLDDRLRASSAERGVADVVAELRGELVNRPAVRSARRAKQEQVRAAADDAMRTTGLASLPWVPGWLQEIQRSGSMSRLKPDRAAFVLV
jgi:hypothetical protein